MRLTEDQYAGSVGVASQSANPGSSLLLCVNAHTWRCHVNATQLRSGDHASGWELIVDILVDLFFFTSATNFSRCTEYSG